MNEQATLLQIDLQNLSYIAKARGQKIDIEKIWDHFNGRESEVLMDALVYLIRGEDFDNSKFEAKIDQLGYKIRAKQAIKSYKGGKSFYRNTNHDVMVVIDCLDRLDSFNKLILMSGNGDFADLCKYVRQKGKKVEIWSFKESYNPVLEPHADKIHFIDDEDFLYKRPSVSVFGFNWEPQDRITK
jgi:uncharacterized LabA/DUF88 family protein